METLGSILGPVLLAAWILGNYYFLCAVVLTMFANDRKALAWWSIVLTLLIWGPLMVFYVGWFYSDQWGCRKLMQAWTIWFFATLPMLCLLGAQWG